MGIRCGLVPSQPERDRVEGGAATGVEVEDTRKRTSSHGVPSETVLVAASARVTVNVWFFGKSLTVMRLRRFGLGVNRGGGRWTATRTALGGFGGHTGRAWPQDLGWPPSAHYYAANPTHIDTMYVGFGG